MSFQDCSIDLEGSCDFLIFGLIIASKLPKRSNKDIRMSPERKTQHGDLLFPVCEC